MSLRPSLLAFLFLALISFLRAEDGYRLWLRYELLPEETRREALACISGLVEPGQSSPILQAAKAELRVGLSGLLGRELQMLGSPERDGAIQFILGEAPALASQLDPQELKALGEEGYLLRRVSNQQGNRIVIAGNTEKGLLYGSFALLRQVQTGQKLAGLRIVSAPKIKRRVLNHWDGLRRFSERGYAGQAIWEWFYLPDYVSPRYRDYARACASVGINGAVLNNVNAEAEILSAEWLEKVKAIASELRPYGIRVYLSARYSAPMDLGGLKTTDPLDADVKKWWGKKAAEIYASIPDFGGFLVKANSEGQPGPQAYGRTHVDGANMMAEALAPYGGIIMWRAFVYESTGEDRAKQAYGEFQPQDGRFRDNVIVQIKNGAIDFMPREPFHPLFGSMPRSKLGLEVQITQEYLGASTHLAYLAPMWEEVLKADTLKQGPGSSVARVVDGSLSGQGDSLMAGVANIGTDRNWCGHPLASANWYAFGRLAWDHGLSSATIAEEYTRQTFSDDPEVLSALKVMLLESREAVVNYEMPLGLHHLMAYDHHYGPAPWGDSGSRPDWNPVYYHRSDAQGIGFDRGPQGSRALDQYAPEIARFWSKPETCPEEFLLWFNHVPWDFRLRSGKPLWEELCLRYQKGVDTVRAWQKTWDSLQGKIDNERFMHVKALLGRQEREAREWRDASTLYFQTFSNRAFPAGLESAEHPLEYYKATKRHYVPGTPGAR